MFDWVGDEPVVDRETKRLVERALLAIVGKRWNVGKAFFRSEEDMGGAILDAKFDMDASRVLARSMGAVARFVKPASC